MVRLQGEPGFRFGRGDVEGLFGDRCKFGGVMRFNLSLLRFLSFSLLLAFSGITARTQSDPGTIAGTVEDSSGGVVTGAQVTVKGADTSSEYSTFTGPTGGFRIPEVKIGIYTITVQANGFKTEEKTGVQVQVNTVATEDFSLTIGDVKDTLTVVADAPGVQSESSRAERDGSKPSSVRRIVRLPHAWYCRSWNKQRFIVFGHFRIQDCRRAEFGDRSSPGRRKHISRRIGTELR